MCQDYRPISLLNTDLKIFTKILAPRLAPEMPSIINYDQVGFVQGREARDSVTRVLNLLRLAQIRSIPHMLLSTDAKKTFDRVSWTF